MHMCYTSKDPNPNPRLQKQPTITPLAPLAVLHSTCYDMADQCDGTRVGMVLRRKKKRSRERVCVVSMR
jgi:hypothetical protein